MTNFMNNATTDEGVERGWALHKKVVNLGRYQDREQTVVWLH